MAETTPAVAQLVVSLGLLFLWAAGMWKVFVKAGHPGWKSLIPIYNIYILLKIGGNPGWYLLLLVIPLVNFVVMLKLWADVLEVFGRGDGWVAYGWLFGLLFLPYIFIPLLGFGGYTYQGEQGGQAAV